VQGMEIVFPHWISTLPAKPVARLCVGPQDFPFLGNYPGRVEQVQSDRLYFAALFVT
jgi:hypothetical protein